MKIFRKKQKSEYINKNELLVWLEEMAKQCDEGDFFDDNPVDYEHAIVYRSVIKKVKSL